ncbi:DUF2975 domain-containing protein [Caulobacter sp. 17J80-11]|uniref:DUF2975 domain-containing protein n=1 Tax=Caulobacter sp. 17J80-11 TaxID=2763502 RepID=UPI0016536CE3|nr:DUF2975 domain-containing protein [Caulobacter sp. 17J80-11]MBC6982840.1 DUF2975 domain-containing protein [Caulobacter sp. 17J80-11]
MRAMGPGSVSSLLKVALDVVHVVLWIAIGGLLLITIASLIVPLPGEWTADLGEGAGVELTPLKIAPIFAGAAGYTAILLFVVRQLRRVFATLTAGDPFHPDNFSRLRLIGAGLAALEIANMLSPVALAWLLGASTQEGRGIDLTAWFSVLVVFVLAEVFREGARLRREAELTI